MEGGKQADGKPSERNGKDSLPQDQQHGTKTIIDDFRKDESLSKFLNESFDSTTYISSLIGNVDTKQPLPNSRQNLEDALLKLNSGLSVIDKELNSQVASHHEELLNQVTTLKDLEDMLQVVKSGVDTLQASVDKISKEINEPLGIIKSKTIQLSRLQSACDLLRKVIRFMYLSRKLHGHMQQGNREIAKAAQCILEIQTLRSESDISGIHIIDNQSRYIQKANEDIISNAQRLLLQGLEGLNQSDVAVALQVFFNLGLLKNYITSTLQGISDKLYSSIRSILSAQVSSSVVTVNTSSSTTSNPNPTSTTPASTTDDPIKVRSQIWARIEKILDALHNSGVQVFHLQRVLSKLKDPSTHVYLYDPGENTIVQNFWKEMTLRLTEILETSTKSTVTIAQNVTVSMESIFVSEFPKMHRLFLEFLKRLHSHYELRQLTVSGISQEEQTQFMNTISSFRTSFLNRSISRMMEYVNKIFPASSPNVIPSVEEVNNLISIIAGELDLAVNACLVTPFAVSSSSTIQSNGKPNDGLTDDMKLALSIVVAVSKNSTKTIKLFVAKMEPLVAMDNSAYQMPELSTSSGNSTPTISQSQLKNAKIFNSLHQLHSAVHSMLNNISHSNSTSSSVNTITTIAHQVGSILREGVSELEKLMDQIISPLFARITKYLELSIFSLHKEDFGGNEISANDAQPLSQYMRLFQAQTAQFQGAILSKYPSNSLLINGYLKKLASRLVMYFVRHASLIRPLGEGGKMKLAADMAQLEFAVTQLSTVKELGLPYQALRSLRRFIFAETSQISETPESFILPPSVVLHHLICRAPASSGLQLPFQIPGWNLSHYSTWMDSHSEEDVWALIKSALEAYAAQVNARREKEFTPVYPVILSLGPALISKWKEKEH